jgi:hypothetical protein
MHNLFAPLIAERVNTPQGVREIAVVAGVSDDLFGIDVANGEPLWNKHFDTTFPGGGRVGDALCPGGQTAVPALGRAATAGQYTIYAVSWDGRLRQVNLADGKDVAPPEKFMPPNGKPYALNLVNGVIYTPALRVAAVPTRLFVRPRHSQVQHVPARRRRIVGATGRGDLTEVSPTGTGDAAFNPATKSLGNGSSACDPTQTSNCNWSTTSARRTRTGCGVEISTSMSRPCPSTTADANSWWHEQGMPDVAARSRRTRRRRPSHDAATTPLLCSEAQAFDGHGVWGDGHLAGRRGTQWVLVPSGAKFTRTFTHRSSIRGRRAAAWPPTGSKSRPENGN